MRFPEWKEGVRYLAEGGQETGIMCRFGHELPEFAMFTLLEKPAAMAQVRGMYERYLEVAARPDFHGINCSHPAEFEPALEPGDWIRRVRSLRPNASRMDKVSLCKLGHLESGDAVELGREMGDLARRYPHMDVWGGCCGTWETDLDEIARNVRAVASSG